MPSAAPGAEARVGSESLQRVEGWSETHWHSLCGLGTNRRGQAEACATCHSTTMLSALGVFGLVLCSVARLQAASAGQQTQVLNVDSSAHCASGTDARQ